jgi:hypothetical protein
MAKREKKVVQQGITQGEFEAALEHAGNDNSFR